MAGSPPTGYGKIGPMAKQRKKKRFRAVEAIKARAREQIGTPPASRVIPERKKSRTEKHPPTLSKLLGEE
jgi:hypothetical protein